MKAATGMRDVRPEVLEEVEDCIRRVKAFQEAQGRQVHKLIKRSRKGRKGMAELAQFNLAIPDDFRMLYHNYNGTNTSGVLSMWEQTVFLDFDWLQMDQLVISNQIMRLDKDNPLGARLFAFSATTGLQLELAPDIAKDGAVPLVMTLGLLSRKSFIAFDSTLAMLRSVCAAQDAGILHYENKNDTPGKGREIGEIHYDLKELWDVIRPFNPRADYWPKMIEEPIDWEEIEVELPEDGILRLDPEVRRLIIGDPKAYHDAAEDEMRKAAFSEDQIQRARTIERD